VREDRHTVVLGCCTNNTHGLPQNQKVLFLWYFWCQNEPPWCVCVCVCVRVSALGVSSQRRRELSEREGRATSPYSRQVVLESFSYHVRHSRGNKVFFFFFHKDDGLARLKYVHDQRHICASRFKFVFLFVFPDRENRKYKYVLTYHQLSTAMVWYGMVWYHTTAIGVYDVWH
jgi:hypothetical protein